MLSLFHLTLGLTTCGDVQDAFRAQQCCNQPNNTFSVESLLPESYFADQTQTAYGLLNRNAYGSVRRFADPDGNLKRSFLKADMFTYAGEPHFVASNVMAGDDLASTHHDELFVMNMETGAQTIVKVDPKVTLNAGEVWKIWSGVAYLDGYVYASGQVTDAYMTPVNITSLVRSTVHSIMTDAPEWELVHKTSESDLVDGHLPYYGVMSVDGKLYWSAIVLDTTANPIWEYDPATKVMTVLPPAEGARFVAGKVTQDDVTYLIASHNDAEGRIDGFVLYDTKARASRVFYMDMSEYPWEYAMYQVGGTSTLIAGNWDQAEYTLYRMPADVGGPIPFTCTSEKSRTETVLLNYLRAAGPLLGSLDYESTGNVLFMKQAYDFQIAFTNTLDGVVYSVHTDGLAIRVDTNSIPDAPEERAIDAAVVSDKCYTFPDGNYITPGQVQSFIAAGGSNYGVGDTEEEKLIYNLITGGYLSEAACP